MFLIASKKSLVEPSQSKWFYCPKRRCVWACNAMSDEGCDAVGRDLMR